MPAKTLLLLLGTNLIWSAHPAMGKLVLEDFSPTQGAWLRYVSAFLSYALWALWRRGAGRPWGRSFARPAGLRDAALIFGLGFSAFCCSPLLQMTGLEASSAVDSALIIAMEPLLTVLLACVFLGERLSIAAVSCLGIALGGFGLLAGWTPGAHLVVGGALPAHLVGNFLLLCSLLGEAAYSVLGRKLVDRYEPLPAFGSAILVGAVSLTVLACLMGGPGLPLARMAGQLSWKSALGLFWLGPLGTTGCYLAWIVSIRRAPVASLALTLFVQPLFGSLWGSWFLGERLSGFQWLGGALIVAAVAGQMLWGLRAGGRQSAGAG